MHPYKLRCPVFNKEKDDICNEPIWVNAWKGEKQTFWYPGSPPGFEVMEADCGHVVEIERDHYDDILQQLTDADVGAMEAAMEARIARERDEEYERRHRLQDDAIASLD